MITNIILIAVGTVLITAVTYWVIKTREYAGDDDLGPI